MSLNDEEATMLIGCAMNHLRYYPDVWKLIGEFIRLEKETDIMTTPNSIIASINISRLEQIGLDIERELRKIIRDVESGIPLRGVCEICAAVSIGYPVESEREQTP